MNGIVRKIISTVAAAAVALAVVTVPAAPGSVAEAAMTENCDGNHSGMTAWTDENDLPTSGNYYLDTDVNLSTYKTISGSLTLCLNGHTVTAASSKHILSIQDSLTLCDCSSGKTGKLIGGRNDLYSGGAVDVDGGTFTMNGGTISGNTAGTGGGVFVRSGASFIMNGGTISNNISDSHGGGVYNRGIFTMNGGTISGNRSNINAGGGVFVAASGTFIMNGGMISSNTAYTRGGGVYVNKDGGTFTMSGGIISGNTAADFGGGVCTNGTFEINGKVNISGNTKTDGSDNNVCLLTGKKISIGNAFNTSSTIGVTTETAPTCSSPVAVTGNTTKDISASFTADIDGQITVYKNNTVQLSVAHSFDEPPQTTPATCTTPGSEIGTCSICSETVTQTAPALGHNWGAWTVTTPATSTQNGTETRTCLNDPTHTETREIAALGGGNSGGGSGSGSSGSGGSSGSSSSGSSSSSKTPSIAEVELDGDVPETELANSDSELKDALLTEAELENADDITIVLRVKDSDPGADKQTIETRLASTDGFKVGQYFDVSLFKVVNGSESKLTKTNKPIKVRFEIPRELRAAGRTFAVIRVHDGAATLLRDLDNDSDTITIETDKFSTYALIYSDSPTAASNPYTGTTTALFPTALLAAAVMLLTKRRKN